MFILIRCSCYIIFSYIANLLRELFESVRIVELVNYFHFYVIEEFVVINPV